MRTVIACVLIVGLGVAQAKPMPPPAAPVDTGEVIGLLDVRIEGLSADASAAFTEKIEQSLEISGLKVAPLERLRQYLAGTPWNLGCYFGTCLMELHRQTGVATVIEVALATSGPSYHYVITLLDAKTGQPRSQTSGVCDVCTTDEAFGEASLAVVGLVNGVSDLPSDDAPPKSVAHRDHRPAVRTRWLAGSLLGLAAAAAAGSWYFFREDRDTLGGASAGAAGALGVAGVTTLAVSFTF